MAKKSDQDAFKAWVEQVSSKLPEEKKKLLESVVGDDVLSKEVFSGFMGEKFLYTRLNEVKGEEARIANERAQLAAQAGQIKGWYDSARPEYESALAQKVAYEKYLEELGVNPELALKGEKVPVKTTNREREADDELSERLDRMDYNLPPLLGAMGRIIQRSIKDNIDVDPNEILQYSIKNHVTPYQAYDELTFEARKERAEKERAAELEAATKKAREEGKREALAQTQSLDHVRPQGPTIFDTLNAEKPKDPTKRVDAAIQAFREIQSGAA